jgi:hypothetical protein
MGAYALRGRNCAGTSRGPGVSPDDPRGWSKRRKVEYVRAVKREGLEAIAVLPPEHQAGARRNQSLALSSLCQTLNVTLTRPRPVRGQGPDNVQGRTGGAIAADGRRAPAVSAPSRAGTPPTNRSRPTILHGGSSPHDVDRQINPLATADLKSPLRSSPRLSWHQRMTPIIAPGMTPALPGPPLLGVRRDCRCQLNRTEAAGSPPALPR